MRPRRHLAQIAATAVAAAAVVSAPIPASEVTDPAPPVASPVFAHVDLAALARPVTPTPKVELDAVRDALGRLSPDSAAYSVLAGPAPQNAASDWITAGYEFVMEWVDYGVELATYVLQFVPFGYLISAQVNIVYDTLVVPIADSVVYDLVNPVVNAPLDLGVWINGIADVAYTSAVSLINAGIAELNYFFGWLIPPLPPLPFAVEAEAEAEGVVDDPALFRAEAATEVDTGVDTDAEELPEIGDQVELSTAPEDSGIVKTPENSVQIDEVVGVVVNQVKADAGDPLQTVALVDPETPVEVEVEDQTLAGLDGQDPPASSSTATNPTNPTNPTTPTRSTSNGISAQGEVRTGPQFSPGQGTAPAATPSQHNSIGSDLAEETAPASPAAPAVEPGPPSSGPDGPPESPSDEDA